VTHDVVEADNPRRYVPGESFLDISGNDPMPAFVAALLAACNGRGPVFVYSAAFEETRIRELAKAFPRESNALLALLPRIVDLLPIARERYYHPSMKGSWSIKTVLPAAAPDLAYGALDGVQDGGSAMEAYLEAVRPGTSAERIAEIRCQLRNSRFTRGDVSFHSYDPSRHSDLRYILPPGIGPWWPRAA
jgi:Domain of unknown function(DUF2779)